MMNYEMLDEKHIPVRYKFFDFSLLLYFIAYFFHYQDTAFDAEIRLIATLMILISGILLNLKNYKYVSACTVWYGLFVALCSASILWAPNPNQASSIIITLLRVLLIGHFLSIRIQSNKDVETILNIFLIAVLYMTVRIGILMANFYSFSLIYVTRFGDNFGYNSNTTSIMSLICILICLHKIERGVSKIAISPLIIYFIMIMIATASKKGYFGLAIGIFLMLYFKDTGKKQIRNIFWAICVLGALYISVMTIPTLYDQIGHRLVDMWNTLFFHTNSSYSTESRIMLIKEALKVWENNPILGVGINNFSSVRNVPNSWYSHCNYVEILADLGVLGFAVYYFVPFMLLKSKYETDYGTGRLLKVIIIILLLFDFAMVSYQELYSLVFFWLYEKTSEGMWKFSIGK